MTAASALALLLLLASPVSAHGPGRPELFGRGTQGVAFHSDPTTYTLPRESRVYLGDVRCDLTELLAASREWSRVLGPGNWAVYDDPDIRPGPIGRMTWEIVEIGDNTIERAEQRWRRAVEACR